MATGSLDPLALVVAAKQRHYAYKPIAGSSSATPFLGSDYTPSYQQGANPIQNPGADANLRIQNAQTNPAAALAARYKPQSPMNAVEPTANGIPLPNFAEGGDVVSKAAKVLKEWLGKSGSDVGAISTDPQLQRLRAFGTRQQGNSLDTAGMNKLVSDRAAAPNENQMMGIAPQPISSSEAQTVIDPSAMAAKIRTTMVDPRHLDVLQGRDQSLDTLIRGYKMAAINGDIPDDLRSALANKLENVGKTPEQLAAEATPQAPAQGQMAPPQQASPAGPQMAEGGSTSESSLKWLADMARKMGVSSMAEDRARVATGIAKQAYGLDEYGEPVLGGDAWTKDSKGTPPRILDELTSIPGSVVTLLNAVNGKGPEGTSTPNAPQWSTDAGERLDQLDKKVKQTTGVGDAQTLPEHIEDAAGMLASPIPASSVAKEAPMLQRALEYLTPVRPPTLARYATDAAGLGSASAGLDALAARLAAKKSAQNQPEQVDPEFEDAAIADTNAAPGMAGGGSTRRDLLQKLLGLGAVAGISPAVKMVVKDAPEAVAPLASQAATGITHDPTEIHGLIKGAKNELFGATDEPNWNAVTSLLSRIPGSKSAVDQLKNYHDWVTHPDTDIFSPEGAAENSARVAGLEGHIDNLSFRHDVPIVPNPNDENVVENAALENSNAQHD
jgi:hypothetical protein